MGVRFVCHACQRRLNVKSELAGKKGKCPSCGTRFRIPDSDSDFSIPLTSDTQVPSGGPAASSGTSQGPSARPRTTDPAAPDQPTASQRAPQQPAPEQPAPEQPAPEQPAPEQPAPARVVEQATPAAADRPIEPTTTPPPPPVAPAPTDLLDADPTALWYVRPPSGGQYGPATGSLLKEWIGEGRVAAASLLWREGWSQWRRAEEVVPLAVSSQDASIAADSAIVGQASAATNTATVEQPAHGGQPAPITYPADHSGDSTGTPPPPGRIKRQRTIRRVTTIGILAGLSILLLIVLIFVVIRGLGE